MKSAKIVPYSMASFLASSLSVLLAGVYAFAVCWFRLYEQPVLLAGLVVFAAVMVAAFWLAGRSFPDEKVDYQAGMVFVYGENPQEFSLADLKEIRLLPALKTRRGNTKQPIQFVLHNGYVIEGFGSYKFFRDISDYAAVYDIDGTPFYPKEVYFYGMLALWVISGVLAAAGVAALFWHPGGIDVLLQTLFGSNGILRR